MAETEPSGTSAAPKALSVAAIVVSLLLPILGMAVVWGGVSERVKRFDTQLDRLEEITREHAKDHSTITGALADHGARLGALERRP